MLALRIKKAVRNGATLVVADPRKIWLTKIAKRHLQLRPGTDVWLLNAMMHVILEEGLQDEEYIREHTEDFEAVREVVSRYTPEEAEKVTGVPAEAIRATAREYAAERHAAIFYTLGITEHACGVDNIWSLSNLVLMTGHLGYESTGLNALRGQNNVQGLNDSGANPSYLPGYQAVDDPEIRREVLRGVGRRGARDARLPARPDRVRACTTGGSRRSTWSARTRRRPSRTPTTSRRGSASCEFIVSQDIFLNDSTRKYADVVLPGVELRREGRHLHEHRAAREPRAARRSTARARRARTGGSSATWRSALGADWPEYETRRGRLERVRRPLRRTGTGSATTGSRSTACSGRAPTSTHPGTPYLHAPAAGAAERQGRFFPVEYQPPIEQPDSEYPFVLSTGRTLYHYNSATMTMREPGVTDKQEAPFFEINAEDAQALGHRRRRGRAARLAPRRARGRGALLASASTRGSSGWRSTSPRRR